MAKKVKESKITRFEYTVINEKWFLYAEDGTGKLSTGEVVPYIYFYLSRGEHGTRRFVYGCPETSLITGKPVTMEEAVANVETFLLHSMVHYIKEEDAIEDYYASLDEEC